MIEEISQSIGTGTELGLSDGPSEQCIPWFPSSQQRFQKLDDHFVQ